MPAVTLYRLLGERRINDYVRPAAGPRRATRPVPSSRERLGDAGETARPRNEIALWKNRPDEPTEPDWLDFIAQAFPDRSIDVHLGSPRDSVLMVVRWRIEGEYATWAIAFGQAARHWIDATAIDKEGHILGAISCIRDQVTGELNSLTGLSTHEISLNVQRITREIPTGTGLADYDYDRDIQVLRGAQGRPSVTGVGKSISGSEGVRLTGIDDFSAILEAVRVLELRIRGERSGGARLPGPRPVVRGTKAQLDEVLVQQIRANAADIVLALPADALAARVYFTRLGNSTNARKHVKTGVTDPDLKTYCHVLRQTGKLNALTSEDIRRAEVVKHNDPAVKWPLYAYLSGRIDVADETYVIEDGEWYRAPRDWIESLNTRVDGLPVIGSFPRYNHPNEAKYNEELALSLGRALVLDSRLISGDGFSTRIEIADVLAVSKVDGKDTLDFIHVKRDFASSTLSHLFNQSTTAALALPERSVREALWNHVSHTKLATSDKKRIGKLLRYAPGDGTIDPERVRVIIGIVGPWNSRKPSEAIPVLARAAMQRCIQRLRARGHQVFLATIST